MRFSFPLLIAISVSFFFLACGGETQENTSKKSIFHYNQPNPITSLDPVFAKSQNNIWACDHLYNRLVELDDNLNVIPAIAKSWTVSDDGLVYTFNLRDDIYFHDNDAFPDQKGRQLVAEDVVYSFNRLIDPKVASPGSWIFQNKLVTSEPFKAISPTQFELRLKEAFRPILGILSMHYCSIVPKEAVDQYGDRFRSNPVGTGPFQLKKWLENQSLFLAKNPNYFEKEGSRTLPYLDGVRVSFIGDKKSAFLELMGNKLDLISGLESSYTNELLNANGNLKADLNSKIQFLKSPFLNTEYLGINLNLNQVNPLAKKKVRQALNYGFDRKLMLQKLRNNVGTPAQSGFVPKGLPSYSTTVKGYSYQIDKARQLLAEAGFPNGEGLPRIELYTNKDYLDLCTFIVRQWEDLGIKVQIEVLESATLRNKMTKGEVPFFRASWIADYPDEESYFTVFYSKNPAPPNYTRFNNAQFDALYEQALQENDDQKRQAIYQKMDQLIIEEAPVIFLFYDETALFAQKNIKGLSKNALNLLALKRVKKD